MNNNYIHEYSNALERIFSFGYLKKYSTSMIEKEISYHPFFQKLEQSRLVNSLIISDLTLINDIYKIKKDNIDDIPVFNQCAWASEAYIHIQNETHLSYEAIFIYIPLKKMYDYFPLYHEMDFTQIVNEFKRLLSLESVLSKVMNKYGYSLKYISDETNIPYDSLKAYKSRKRNIKSINGEYAYRLATLLHIRIETLLELSL